MKSGGLSQPVAQPPYVPDPPRAVVTTTEEEGLEDADSEAEASPEASPEESALAENDSDRLSEDHDPESDLSSPKLSEEASDTEREGLPAANKSPSTRAKTPVLH